MNSEWNSDVPSVKQLENNTDVQLENNTDVWLLPIMKEQPSHTLRSLPDFSFISIILKYLGEI